MVDIIPIVMSTWCVACKIEEKPDSPTQGHEPATFIYKGASLCEEHFLEVVKYEKENEKKMKTISDIPDKSDSSVASNENVAVKE